MTREPRWAGPCKKLIVGVGSSHGDDQIGWRVVEYLRSRVTGEVDCRCARSPLEILHWLDDVEWLGICDACQGSGPAGTWHHWRWPDKSLSHQRFSGTHDLALGTVLELALQCGTLPHTVGVWGVEVARCEPNAGLSDALERIVPEIAAAMELESGCLKLELDDLD